jgi:DNA repair exonuclease SbcCD ATPase subunit
MVYRFPSWTELKKQRLVLLISFATLLLLMVVYVIWLAPVESEKNDLQAKVKQQTEIIKKYREKLEQAQTIKDNLVRKESELQEMQKRLFRGNDPYQLAASLGERLSSKGDSQQKLDIKTYQVLESKEYGLYQEVHLRFNFMTTIEGLQYFLDRVRKFETAMQVQEINIQRIQRKSGPDLVINVILAALMEKKEKS